MTGDAAADYARKHLDETRTDGQGKTYFVCPETDIGWTEERAPSGYGHDQRRLRRTERT